MEIFAGLITLAVALGLVLVMITRRPSTRAPLLAAYASRVFILALHNIGIFGVPGGDADAISFQYKAVNWSSREWPELWSQFSFSSSFMYSWLGAILFKATTPSELMFQAFNVIFGIVICYTVYVAAESLWGSRRAVIALWLCALYPFAIFNSVITLREEISIMFFMVGVYYSIIWIRGNNPLALVSAFGGFSIAALFHGGWAAAAAAFGIVVFRETFLPSKRNRKPKNDIFSILSASLIVFAILFLGGNEVKLSSGVGNPLDKLTGGVIDDIESTFGQEKKAEGGSAYPAFVIQGDPFTQPWVLPLRITYFLFSPFPWDVRSLRHVFGFVGSFAYCWLFWNLWKLRRVIWTDRVLQSLCLIAASIIFVFAMGTSNVGTALRHRTKVLAVLAVIAAGGCYRDQHSCVAQADDVSGY